MPRVFDAIFYAGGHGTLWDFPDDPEPAADRRLRSTSGAASWLRSVTASPVC